MPRINLPTAFSDFDFDTTDVILDLDIGLSESELEDFIVALDDTHADSDFTVTIIKRLINALIEEDNLENRYLDEVVSYIEERTERKVKRKTTKRKSRKKTEVATNPSQRPSRFTEIDLV